MFLLVTLSRNFEVKQSMKYKKCPYLELFWSLFSRIRTEYGEIRSISLYLIRRRENTGQNNSKNGHFSRRGSLITCSCAGVCSSSYSRKVVLELFEDELHLKKITILKSQWKLFKIFKNSFYFISKALFALKIFKLLSWLIGYMEKTAWLEI